MSCYFHAQQTKNLSDQQVKVLPSSNTFLYWDQVIMIKSLLATHQRLNYTVF